MFFMLGIGVWIGISISDISETGMVAFWAIWLIGVGFLLTRIKKAPSN